MTLFRHIAPITLTALLLPFAPALAESHPQSWIPQEIVLPEDMEIVTDRSIGASNRMFSFTTKQDPDTLSQTWRAALEQAPYQVKPASETLDRRLIEFSGQSIRNGQIAFIDGPEGSGATVQFDASLAD